MNYDNPKKVIATRRHYELMFARMVMELSNPDKVLKGIGRTTEAYEDLKYDAHVASCIQSRKAGVLSMKWEINRGGDDTQEVEFIKDIFKKLKMVDIINELLDAPYLGFRVAEIYWQYRDGKIVPAAIIGKPSHWFFFDENNMPRFRQAKETNGVALPKRKFFVLQHNATYDNPFGEALLAKCYWPVFYKKDVVNFWATFCEKYGMPYLVGHVPIGSSSEESDELKEDLEEMRQDAVIVVEGEKDVSIMDASNSGRPALFQNFIQFFNTEISKAILSQTLTTEQTGKTGSYAISKTHQEVRQDVIDADRQMVEQCFNDLIQWTMEFNFPNVTEYPKFEFYQEEDVDMVLAQRDEILSKQIEFTEDYYMQNYGLKATDFKIRVVVTPPVAGGFAEGESGQPPTEGLDKVKELGTADFEKVNEEMLNQVLGLIDEGKSYDDIESKLMGILPELDTTAIEDLIAKGIIVANAGGRLA